MKRKIEKKKFIWAGQLAATRGLCPCQPNKGHIGAPHAKKRGPLDSWSWLGPIALYLLASGQNEKGELQIKPKTEASFVTILKITSKLPVRCNGGEQIYAVKPQKVMSCWYMTSVSQFVS